MPLSLMVGSKQPVLRVRAVTQTLLSEGWSHRGGDLLHTGPPTKRMQCLGASHVRATERI